MCDISQCRLTPAHAPVCRPSAGTIRLPNSRASGARTAARWRARAGIFRGIADDCRKAPSLRRAPSCRGFRMPAGPCGCQAAWPRCCALSHTRRCCSAQPPGDPQAHGSGSVRSLQRNCCSLPVLSQSVYYYGTHALKHNVCAGKLAYEVQRSLVRSGHCF